MYSGFSCFRTSTWTLLLSAFIFLPSLPALEPLPDPVNRFETYLIQNPGPGAAFDRVTDWFRHDGPGIELLQRRWTEAAATDETHAAAYNLLLGLLAEHRDQPDTARIALTQAADMMENPLPALRALAALESSEGDLKAAAAHYRRILEILDLPAIDQSRIRRALALVLQRSFREEEAVAVWDAAVDESPNDPFVLEDAGEAFLAATAYDRAREVFQRLAELPDRTPAQRLDAQLRLADVEAAANDVETAAELYEAALQRVLPNSWRAREIRSQLDRLFRSRDDLPGLLAHLENRLEKDPKDYQSRQEISDLLWDLGRFQDALAHLDQALQLAPENPDLRTELAMLQAELGNFSAAIEVLEPLANQGEPSIEVLKNLGIYHWKQFEDNEDPAARASALSVWNRIAPSDSMDPAAIAQLARILSDHEFQEKAHQTWRRVLEVAPEDIEARTWLAQEAYENDDVQTGDAILTPLIADNRATAENYLTLLRVLARLDQEPTANRFLVEALNLFPDNFSLLTRAWQQARLSEDLDRMAELFPRFVKAAPNLQTVQFAVQQYAMLLEYQEEKKAHYEALQQRFSENPASLPLAEQLLLFELAVANEEKPAAAAVMQPLLSTLDPMDAVQLRVQYLEAFESLGTRVEILRELAEETPRLRNQLLREAAILQADLGHFTEAMAALKELIDQNPTNPALYQDYIRIAFANEAFSEAETLLYSGIRHLSDPNWAKRKLVSLYQMEDRLPEALALLDEMFQSESKKSTRMAYFRQLVDLSMLAGRIDPLIAKLKERQAAEETGSYYGVYLAEIYLEMKDYTAAHRELLKVLGENPQEPDAVERLLQIAEWSGDKDEVIRLSERLVELQPSAINKAAQVKRIIQMGRKEDALERLEALRTEIAEDLPAWGDVFVELAHAGWTEELHEILEVLALTAERTPENLWELARLEMQADQWQAATARLWSIVDTVEFANVWEALENAAPQNPNLPTPYNRGYRQGLNPNINTLLIQLARESQQALYRLGQSSFSSIHPLGRRQGSTALPAAMEARLQALFTLATLAKTTGQVEAFVKRFRQVVDRHGLAPDEREHLARAFNLPEKEYRKEWLEEHLASPAENIALDVRLLNVIQQERAWQDLAPKFLDRIRQLDPERAYTLELTSPVKSQEAPDPPKSVDDREGAKRVLDYYWNHPDRHDSPEVQFALASMAIEANQMDTAERLAEKLFETSSDTINEVARRNLATQLFASYWNLGQETKALHWLTSAMEMKEGLKFPGGLQPYVYSFHGARQIFSPLLQERDAPTIGDPRLPWNQYHHLKYQLNKDRRNSFFDAMVDQDPEWSKWDSAQFYQLWLEDSDAAFQRAEAVYATHPSPELAMLLFETYEISDQPHKALAIIDATPLQPAEDSLTREIRRIRLLMKAEQKEEVEKRLTALSKGNHAQMITQTLGQLMQQAGMNQAAQQQFQTLHRSPSRQYQSRQDPRQAYLQQLQQEERNDALERLAIQILQSPLPNQNDHHGWNLRQHSLQQLANINRLQNYQFELEQAIEGQPDQVALRLRQAELEMNRDRERIPELVQAAVFRPEFTRHDLIQAMQILNRCGLSNEMTPLFVACLEKRPELVAGFQLHQIRSNVQNLDLETNQEVVERLAAALLKRSSLQLRQVFLKSLLTYHSGLSQLFHVTGARMGEIGDRDQQLALLLRALEEADSANLDLSLINEVASVQIALDEQANAKKHLQLFLDALDQRGSHTAAYLLRRSHGLTEWLDQLNTYTRLTEQAGLYPEWLDKFQKEDQESIASLIIRTFADEPELETRWANFLEKDETPINSQLLLTAIIALAEHESQATIIPALLEGEVSQAQALSNHAAWELLHEIGPMLIPLADDPKVAAYVRDTLLAPLLQNGVNLQNYIFRAEFFDQMQMLARSPFADEARQMVLALNSTSQVKQMKQSVSMRRRWEKLELLLDTTDQPTQLTVRTAAQPLGKKRIRIHWQTDRIFVSSEEKDGRWANTQDQEFDTPIQQLELLAGPNPLAMVPVATIQNPDPSGNRDIDLTPHLEKLGQESNPLGLIQATWTGEDGVKHRSGFSIYALSKPQPMSASSLQERNSEWRKALTSIQGVWGEAFAFDAELPEQEIHLQLADLELKPGQGVAIIGWFESSQYSISLALTVAAEGKPMHRVQHDYLNADMLWEPIFALYVPERIRGYNARTLEGDALDLVAQLSLRANNRSNSEYLFGIEASDLQVIVLPAGWGSTAGQLLDQAKQADSPEQAADLYFQALRANPLWTLSVRLEDLLETYQAVGRLPELFTFLNSPNLFISNPLNQDKPTVSRQAFSVLLAFATQPDAPAEAVDWVLGLDRNHLPASYAAAASSAQLQARFQQGEELEFTEILETIGFDQDQHDIETIKSFFRVAHDHENFDQLFGIIRDHNWSTKWTKLLETPFSEPVSDTARLFLKAWWLAEEDPVAAMKSWEASRLDRKVPLTMRDEALLLKIASGHPTPETWRQLVWTRHLSEQRDRLRRHRSLTQLLHEVWKNEPQQTDEWARLWVEAEFDALAFADYHLPTSRTQDLVALVTAEENPRHLRKLEELASVNPRLNASKIRETLERLERRLAVREGDISTLWPITWITQDESNDGATQVMFQWGERLIDESSGDFDAAIVVTEDPLIETIPGQEQIEWWFGAMPDQMTKIATRQGAEATGKIQAVLPHNNGFLQAIAIVEGSPVPGPVYPVIQGKRLFPDPGDGLLELLTTGQTPLDLQEVIPAGLAPDGSPAFELESRSPFLHYVGPEFPVEPGKCYISQCWIKRTGTGYAQVMTTYQASTASNARNLAMILSKEEELPGDWMLFTRVVPSLPSHTFWIPYLEAKSLVPAIWKIDSGSEIAGFAVYEVEGWAYGEWLKKLAMTRHDREPATLSSEEAAEILDSAGVEPLTALDYHGDWLIEVAERAGQPLQLADLYAQAAVATPNPLVALPKMWRLSRHAQKTFDALDDRPGLQLAAGERMRPFLERGGYDNRLNFQAKLLYAATQSDHPAKAEELEIALRALLFNEKESQLGMNDDFEETLTQGEWKGGRIRHPLLPFLSLPRPESINEDLLTAWSALESKDPNQDLYVELLLNASNSIQADDWPTKIESLLQSMNAPIEPQDLLEILVLTELLVRLEADPEVILDLREKTLHHIQQADSENAKNRLAQLRAGALWLRDATNLADEPATSDATDAFQSILKGISGNIPESAHDSLDTALEAIPEAQRSDLSDLVLEKVNHDSKLAKSLDPSLKD